MDTVRDTATPPTRADVSAAAYLALRDLVAAGRLAAGAPLIEADLSKWLGVSRTPIRAALQRLQQEGFVTPSPVGQMLRPIVSPLTERDLREIFLMVGALEASAARMAASLDSRPRRALALGLAQAASDLVQAAAARPPELLRVLESQRRFHRLLVEAGAGSRLRAEFEVLQPQAERYGRAYGAALVVDTEETVADLNAVAAAVGAGDADSAELCVARLWRRSADRFRRIIAVMGELGTW